MHDDGGTAMLDWETYRHAFEPDGSLLDVVVLDTTVADWNRLLQVVQQHADAVSLTIREVEVPIPVDVAQIFEVSLHSLTILRATLSEIVLCGYFFTPDEIELDLDPRAVATTASAEQLFALLADIAVALGKEVLLTAESIHHTPWFRVSPVDGTVTFTP